MCSKEHWIFKFFFGWSRAATSEKGGVSAPDQQEKRLT